MTTIARLLTIVALTLPLAACAAQAPAAKPGQDAQAGAAAAVTGAAPAAAPATAAQPADRPVQEKASAPARAPARAGAPAAGAPATGSPAVESSAPAPSSTPALSSVPAADTPAVPETTVGGGAANRAPVVTPPVSMPAGPATGSLLQTLLALIAVLGVLGALAWFLKRYGPKAGGGGANLRVVGSLSLGGRERLLVVEVGGQWIVVGASPGRVNALATMPKQEGADAMHASLAPHAPPAASFGDWLKQTIDKRK